MVNIRLFGQAISDQKRRQWLYDGDVIIFKQVAELVQLQQHVVDVAEKIYHPAHPVSAHKELSEKCFLEKADELAKFFSHDKACIAAFRKALVAVGVVSAETLWTRTTLRVRCGREKYRGRASYGLNPHRDTWASNLPAQTNWWMPIYPISPGRALEFYFYYWQSSIANNTKGWSISAFREARRQARQQDADLDTVLNSYPFPHTNEPILTQRKTKILLEPGDIMSFSGAHLHCGIDNSTDACRVSVEARTLNSSDYQSQIGAPNIDGEAVETSMDDYFAMETDHA